MSAPRVGVYPGTFDPVTNGHMDIIERASHLVDRLVVGVAGNAGKRPMFSIAERVEMLQDEVAALGDNTNGTRLRVVPFSGLLIRFAEEAGAKVIVRGLRAVSDFEYEFQMAGMNARLNGRIETAFLMASEGQHFVSSRFVKEIARLGGDVSSFVSPRILERLNAAGLGGEDALGGSSAHDRAHE